MSLRPFVSGRRRRRGELVPTLFMILAVLALCAGAYGLKQTGLLDGGTGNAKASGTTATRSAAGGAAGSTAGTAFGGGSEQSSTDEEVSAEDLERSYQLLRKESANLRSVIEERGSRGEGGAAGAGLDWPLEGDLVVSSEFGPRVHPVLGKEIKHEGIDIAVPLATPVIAAAGGKVIYVGDLEVHGTTLVVDHGNGLATVYCHLSRASVKEGDKVSRGQVLAESGMTGLATGPHLHFEVRVDGEPADPREFLPELPPQVSQLDALWAVAV